MKFIQKLITLTRLNEWADIVIWVFLSLYILTQNATGFILLGILVGYGICSYLFGPWTTTSVLGIIVLTSVYFLFINIPGQLVSVTIITVGLFGYSFVLNNIVDRFDDANKEVNPNPFSNGTSNVKAGYMLCLFFIVLALLPSLYLRSLPIFYVTLLGLFLKSSYNLGFKKICILDFFSHATAYCCFLYIIAVVLDDFSWNLWAFLFISFFTVNSVGYFPYQVRDFESDKKSKHKNSLIILGLKNAQRLCFFFYMGTGIAILALRIHPLNIVMACYYTLAAIPFLVCKDQNFWTYYHNNIMFPYKFYMNLFTKEAVKPTE